MASYLLGDEGFLRHRRQQRPLRISPLEIQQAAQRPHPPSMRLPEQRRDVRIEQRIVPLQQKRLARRHARPGLRCWVMPRELLLRIAHAEQTSMHREQLLTLADAQLGRCRRPKRLPAPDHEFDQRIVW